jgi:hypothetical protein
MDKLISQAIQQLDRVTLRALRYKFFTMDILEHLSALHFLVKGEKVVQLEVGGVRPAAFVCIEPPARVLCSEDMQAMRPLEG